MVQQERTLSAGLLLCNDTERCCSWVDDPSASLRARQLSRTQHILSMLCAANRWQQEKGVRYTLCHALIFPCLVCCTRDADIKQ
jgi:hypothetical protein